MTKMMDALVKAHAKEGLWLEKVPVPQIKDNEILIKVKKTAICGTDLHIYKWDKWSQENVPVPLTIGHEFVGEIVEVGKQVGGYQVGDRVSGEGHVTCSHCRNCRAGKRQICRNTRGIGYHLPGAFAEYIAIPADNAFKIAPDISDELAAIFDPFGNAVHTTLSYDLVGEDVLITGAGPIGIMAAAIAKHVGARYVVVSDVNHDRLELAKKMGATLVVDPREKSFSAVMAELGMTEGFDVGLEMSGNAGAFENMIEVMNHGGKIAMLGIFPDKVAIDWSKVIFKMLQIKGIYGREMYETWYKMSSLIQSDLDISPVITHKFHYKEFQKGFDVLLKGQGVKAILDWES